MSKFKSNYKIIPEYNLVIEFHKGIADLDMYIKFKSKLIKDELYKPDMNYFIDQKNVIFHTTNSDIKKYIEFIESKSKFLGKRKIALITNTPNQVVPTTIYKQKQKKLNQKTEIFSTNEKAFKWLNYYEPFLINKLSSILIDLENSL
ncbi:hypothetical protein [Lutibacter citreus]|uniref:hypothetical protein n=1 Tax=Lutibacter citreus TaxID=2138210 RepID=UPI000DBE42D3|nr:hypothetical protein [Lutibacter citreus]